MFQLHASPGAAGVSPEVRPVKSKYQGLCAFYPINLYSYGKTDLFEQFTKLAPGVSVLPYDNLDASVIRIAGRFPELSDKIGGTLTHFIVIELQPYKAALNRDFRNELALFDTNHERLLWHCCDGLVKQVVSTLTLAGYCFGISFPIRCLQIKDGALAALGCLSGDFGSIRPTVHFEFGPWDAKRVKVFFDALSPFYRPVAALQNRMAVALHAYWIGLTSRHFDQAILGYMTAFEALFGTDSGLEVSHQLGERYAVMMETDPVKRNERYTEFKRFYAQRSNFVHAKLKEAAKTYNVSARGFTQLTGEKVTADKATAGQRAVHQLKSRVTEVLAAVLADDEWLEAFQARKEQDFYLARLFGERPGRKSTNAVKLAVEKAKRTVSPSAPNPLPTEEG